MKFLDVLETAPENTRLMGWNIGYVAAPQGRTRAGGFDVQMLMSRAQQYGLEHRYRKAIRKMEIQDLGAQWALKIAKSVAGTTRGWHLVQEGVLHPDLHAEAVGYLKQAGKLASEQGLRGEVEIAEALSRENIRFSGWKQEMVYELLHGKELAGAHESAEDVRALREILGSEKELDETFVRRWSRMALENKLVSRAKYAEAAEATPARFQAIMQEAEEWGVREGVETKLRTAAMEADVPWRTVEQGLGIPTKSRVVGSTVVSEAVPGSARISKAFDFAAPFLKRHPGKIAIAASAAALMALKPGTLFSGKDDEYNVIEGLRHGGEAERMRRLLTEFGSGWLGKILRSAEDIAGMAPARQAQHGVLSLPKPLQRHFDKFAGATVETRKFAAHLKEQIQTGNKFRAGRKQVEMEAANEMFQLLKGTNYSHVTVVNPAGVRKAAKQAGVSYEKALAGTIGHERFHQAVRMGGLEDTLSEVVENVPEAFRKSFFKTYKGTGAEVSEQVLTEEYLAHSIGARFGLEGKQAAMYEEGLEAVEGLGGLTTSILEAAMPQQASKALSSADKARAMGEQVVASQVGAAAEAMRKGTEFTSPVNLAKAATKAEKIFNNPSVASKFKAGILEPGRQKARRARIMQKAHRKAQVSVSSNSLRPGKRHRQQAGRLVI